MTDSMQEAINRTGLPDSKDRSMLGGLVDISLTSVLVFLISLVLFIRWMRLQYTGLNLVNKIPGPRSLPLLGVAHKLKPGGFDFYNQILEFCRNHGEKGIWRLWLGSHPVVIITKAETAEALLNSSKHITKSLMYLFLLPWLGTGLLTSTGTKWHSRRKLITPTFHFRILLNFLHVFNEQVRIMRQLVGERATKEGAKGFNITPYITHCALDIICVSAMGVSVNAQKDSDSDYVRAIYRITDIIMKRMKTPWFWPDVLFNLLPAGKEHKRCLDILHNFTNKVIAERSTQIDQLIADGSAASLLDFNDVSDSNKTSDEEIMGGAKRKRLLAFMDMLLYSSKTGSALTQEDIREEVDTFMFEGHDTTAASLNWTVYMIGSHPEIQEKIQTEIDEIFADEDRDVTMEDLKRLKYMECVIKETLRMFPIVPLYAREVEENCEIGGYFVPKGTTGVIAAIQLHKDPRYFPDPERFDPDRWTSELSSKRHPYSFVPFSAGPRNCIGQKFAMMEMKVELTYLLRSFTIKSLQRFDELRPTVEIILRPESGIFVQLCPRRLQTEAPASNSFNCDDVHTV